MGIVQGCPGEDDGIVVAKFRLINKTDTPIYVYESISKYEVKINEINYSTIRDININPNQEKVFSLFDGQMDDKEKFYFFIFKIGKHPNKYHFCNSFFDLIFKNGIFLIYYI